MEGQKSLETHIDGSEFSFIIALNDEYEGGGTRIVENNKIVKCNKGDCVIFCGQTQHEGLNVYSGTRYILLILKIWVMFTTFFMISHHS